MDKFSNLPDPILCHILSFLPIKFSVTTSLLARRWQFLWTQIRHLYFDELEYNRFESEDRMGFSDMVYRILLLHNGSIDSLGIFSGGNISRYQVGAWISTAVARNVGDLSLVRVWLPRCCFKCKTLVKLTLSSCKISVDSGLVCLPRLKKLELRINCYENDGSLPNLVSGCSALEDLAIDRMLRNDDCDGMSCCYVRSPTLKSLRLLFDVSCDHEHKLVLDTPALQNLEFADNFSQIIRAENLSSLVVANAWFFRYFNDSEPNINHVRNAFQFVEKLSNVKCLNFTSTGMMKLLDPAFSIATTRFHNLTKLEVAADWHFLAELLQSAYKLESLTIHQVFPIPVIEKDELKCWREPEHVAKCLSSCLKYVAILGFSGGEQELNLIKYVMRHARVLKRLHLDSKPRIHSEEVYSKLDLLQQISLFPRESQDCQIALI